MIRSIFISILRGYQYLISPLLGNRCRFHPTCSEYMIEAVQNFGIFKGFYLGIKRLARCNPMCEGGFDPVPGITTQPNTTEPKNNQANCQCKHNEKPG